MKAFRGYVPWFILAVAIIFLPAAVSSPYVVGIMVFVALYGVLAIGMGLLMGHAGLFSLVHPTWFGLGAVAGIVIAPITFTGYNIGLMTGMKGMVAAIVGGWTMTGTVVAGLGLGLLEGLFGGFVSPGWKDAIALLVMIFFLLYRTIVSSRGVKKV